MANTWEMHLAIGRSQGEFYFIFSTLFYFTVFYFIYGIAINIWLRANTFYLVQSQSIWNEERTYVSHRSKTSLGRNSYCELSGDPFLESPWLCLGLVTEHAYWVWRAHLSHLHFFFLASSRNEVLLVFKVHFHQKCVWNSKPTPTSPSTMRITPMFICFPWSLTFFFFNFKNICLHCSFTLIGKSNYKDRKNYIAGEAKYSGPTS